MARRSVSLQAKMDVNSLYTEIGERAVEFSLAEIDQLDRVHRVERMKVVNAGIVGEGVFSKRSRFSLLEQVGIGVLNNVQRLDQRVGEGAAPELGSLSERPVARSRPPLHELEPERPR
jgi:hypothetical protein